MKITMYELLGMIKDGKAPKYIKHCGAVYSILYFESRNSIDYEDVKSGDLLFADRVVIHERLNDEVEIIEENEDKETKEKEIPEKLIPTSLKGIDNLDEKIEIAHIDTISVIGTVNEIIDYLKSKGE